MYTYIVEWNIYFQTILENIIKNKVYYEEDNKHHFSVSRANVFNLPYTYGQTHFSFQIYETDVNCSLFLKVAFTE